MDQHTKAYATSPRSARPPLNARREARAYLAFIELWDVKEQHPAYLREAIASFVDRYRRLQAEQAAE